jgi:hypothetical protein
MLISSLLSFLLHGQYFCLWHQATINKIKLNKLNLSDFRQTTARSLIGVQEGKTPKNILKELLANNYNNYKICSKL